LRLRRREAVFARRESLSFDGAVLGESSFLLRFFGERDEEDRLLIVNLGNDQRLTPAPEPLLAPPEGYRWGLLWSSESPRYGGSGTAEPESEKNGWHLPGRAAVFLQPRLRLPLEPIEESKEN